jgi:D-alanyl-lipoteichoic acid acyltransferase DltB (MBOAT superfamily)
MAKIYINALTQKQSYKLLFGGLILFILLLNIFSYVIFKVRTAGIQEGSLPVEAFRLFVLITALCSTVVIVFLIIVYYQFKNTTVLVGNRGIAFLSLLRKIRSTWDEVEEVIIMKRPPGDVLHITTINGSFKVGPQFVEQNKDPAEFEYVKKRLMIKNDRGELTPARIEETSIYAIIKKYVPKKMKEWDLTEDKTK